MSVTFFIPGDDDGKYDDLSLNLANSNFSDLMKLLGREEDAKRYYGTWGLPEIKEVLAKIEATSPADFVIADKVVGRFTTCGRSLEYAIQRFAQLKRLLICAHDDALSVSFA